MIEKVERLSWEEWKARKSKPGMLMQNVFDEYMEHNDKYFNYLIRRIEKLEKPANDYCPLD